MSVLTEDGLPVETEWVLVCDLAEEYGPDAYEADFHVPSGSFFADARLWTP